MSLKKSAARVSLVLMLITSTFAPALFAQDARLQTPAAKPFNNERVDVGDPDPALQVLHITDKLAQMPAAAQALQDFHRNRASSTNPSKKTTSLPTPQSLGSRVTFRVLKNLATTNPTWENRSFTLEGSNAVANIWVEDGELSSGNVTDSDVIALGNALLLSTPTNSIAPARGIIENNNTYFGTPPNIDGDGKVDILLYDITEGGSDNNFFVAGFVTPSDLSATGGGNNKDVLYLDTNPGVSSRPIESVLATAAHEYQHLIHYNYDFNEQTFVNEGLSEWAEVLNGYPARNMTFLNDPATYNVRLLEWESGDNILIDYQRAGLFTGYLAERMSPESVGSITQNPNRGRRGYEEVIDQEGLNFEELLKDFHTANLLNDATLDPAFQYFNPTFANVGTIPTSEVDGLFATTTNEETAFIEAGSVQYLVWRNVDDFVFSLDTIEDFDALRERMAIRVLLEKSDGQTSFEDLNAPQLQKYYAGSYDRITLIVTHIQAELTSRLGIKYDASWGSPIEGTISSVSFDNGVVVSGTFFSLSSGANSATATRFEAPLDGQTTLLEVGLSPYYMNQFSSSELPATAPKDLTIKVWEADVNGLPGNELFSLEVTDPRTTGTTSSTLNHFTVDLSAYDDALNDLPDTFFIGYAEAGTDENYMVIGPSAYALENRSYVTRNDGAWGALWDTQFSDSGDNEFPLENTIVPVRAVFSTTSQPVSNEDGSISQSTFSLAQNYPNPFYQTTSIGYELPQAEHVKLTVYNVLGKRVKTLVDRFQPAGNYSITFEADSFPSGLYLYTLEAGSFRKTQRMTIVR
ncbi:MAG: T9SS type A sorting domain-containing protein [Rhodothermales bacterium]